MFSLVSMNSAAIDAFFSEVIHLTLPKEAPEWKEKIITDEVMAIVDFIVSNTSGPFSVKTYVLVLVEKFLIAHGLSERMEIEEFLMDDFRRYEFLDFLSGMNGDDWSAMEKSITFPAIQFSFRN